MTAFLQSDGFQITAVIALIVVMILWAWPPKRREISDFEKRARFNRDLAKPSHIVRRPGR